MRFRLRITGPILAAVSTVWTATAQDATLPPEEIDSAAIVEAVSIPTPGEFFAALNKVERPNWSKVTRQAPPIAPGSRAKNALNLGTRVSDGFIAVEAQDGQQVKNVGKDIIDLAKSLGVSQSILARGNSINDFAENNEWNTLKEELEATENEVKLQMLEQKDDDLVTLVTVGAWLRGAQAVTDMVAENYLPESASLVRQPAIVGHLVSRIDALDQKLQADELVSNVKGGLAEIQTITASEEVPSAENVERIRTITTELVKAVCEPTSAPAP